jgi:hypothetical protein
VTDKKQKYFVAKGQCVTSKKGPLTDKSGELKPEYFEGGKKTFDKLLASGHIVKSSADVATTAS